MWRRRVPMHVRTLHGSCFEEAIHIRGLGEKLRMVLLGFTEVLATLSPIVPSSSRPRRGDGRRGCAPSSRTGWMPRASPRRHATVLRPDRAVRRHVAAAQARRRTRPHLRGGSTAARAESARCGWSRRMRRRRPRRSRGAGAALRCRTRARVPRGMGVLPALGYEGFGIPYAEAMTAGVPVVATPNGGARFVTEEGRMACWRTSTRSAESSLRCCGCPRSVNGSVPHRSSELVSSTSAPSPTATNWSTEGAAGDVPPA